MQEPLRHPSAPDLPIQGFTLTELAIVLGVIGVILGAIWAAASMAYQNQSALKAQQQIVTIVHNIRALYATHPYFLAAGDQTNNLVTAGVFPPDMIVPGGVTYNGTTTEVENGWQGNVVVAESITTTSTFRIAYYGVPATACAQIASGVIGQFSTDGPLQLNTACSVGANSVTNLQTTSLDAVGISTACQANVGAACQSVEFNFNL